MGWRTGLAVVLLSSYCYAENSTLPAPPMMEKREIKNNTVNITEARENLTSIAVIPLKNLSNVVPTLGSMHPPKPELVLFLQSSEQSTPDVKLSKLDHLKKSSKVRNAALGSAIAKVKLSETDIQNTDGSNPRLPPFAFSGDEQHVGTKSDNELESIQLVTTTLSSTTAFEDAKVADSLAEMDRMEAGQKQAAVWQSARAIGAVGAQVPPMESVEDSVDTVIELGLISTVAPTEAPSVTESSDPIAEYNRKIVELARRRRLLKEQGYKEYKKIMFKSGRNIVPVRLFFDTDPHPEMLVEEPFKRSITSPAETDKTTKLVASAEKTFDGPAATKNQLQTTSQALLLSSESPTPSTVTITKSSVPVKDQIVITGVTKGIEDIDGSGWPPTTTTGSVIDTQEELLTAVLHTGEVGKTTQALNLKPKLIVSGEVIERNVTTFEANPPATFKFTGTASSEMHPTSSGSGTSLLTSEFDLSSNTDANLPTSTGEQPTNVATDPAITKGSLSSSSMTTAIKTTPAVVSESKIDSEVTTALHRAFDERSSTTIDITSTTLNLKTPVDITTDAEKTFESLKSKSGTKAPKKSAAKTSVSDSLSRISGSEQSTKITTGAISTEESSEFAKASQMASDSQSLEAGANSPISAEGTSPDFAGNGATHSATFDGKFSTMDTDVSSTFDGIPSDLATNPQTTSDSHSSVTLTNPATFESDFASDFENTDTHSPTTFDAVSTDIATDAQSSLGTSSSKVVPTDEPTTFPEDITRFEKMIEVRPAPSTQKAEESLEVRPAPSTQKGEEPLEMIALPKEEQTDEGLSTSTTPATITEEVHSEATVTVPIPVEAATRPTTGGPPNSLPTMLTMPSLSALSSFSSLSTPVEIATRPRQTPKPAAVAPVASLPLVKKSSGIIGSRSALKKPRRKILKGRKVDISESDRGILAKTTRTRPVTAAERPLYIRQRPGATKQRKSINAFRSGIQRPVLVNESASQIMLRKVHPEQQIYHRTFKIDRPKRMRVRAKNQRGIAARQGGSATNVRSSFPIPGSSSNLMAASQLVITSPLPPKSPPTLKRVAMQPYSLSRQPTFGALHQQVPAVQHSLSPALRADQAAVTLDQLPQRLSIASPLTRTMMPPLNAAVKLPLTQIEPTSETVQRLSDWDRIRAEFLRIKRQQRKLRRKQHEEHARAAAGVKTLTGDRVSPSAGGERTHNHRYFPHNGEIARGVVWREVDSNRDSRALRVDVDPSRRTIDRDAIVNL